MREQPNGTMTIALTAFALSYGLLGVLKRKGLLDSLETQKFMDDYLFAFEQQGPRTPTTDAARVFLDEIFRFLTGPLPRA